MLYNSMCGLKETSYLVTWFCCNVCHTNSNSVQAILPAMFQNVFLLTLLPVMVISLLYTAGSRKNLVQMPSMQAKTSDIPWNKAAQDQDWCKEGLIRLSLWLFYLRYFKKISNLSQANQNDLSCGCCVRVLSLFLKYSRTCSQWPSNVVEKRLN